jgi:hypothetical protein
MTFEVVGLVGAQRVKRAASQHELALMMIPPILRASSALQSNDRCT